MNSYTSQRPLQETERSSMTLSQNLTEHPFFSDIALKFYSYFPIVIKPTTRSEARLKLPWNHLNQLNHLDPIDCKEKCLKVDSKVITDLYHRNATTARHKEYFLKTWLSSTIIPLHKKGSKAQCDNNRLISLTSQPSKVLTNILLN